MIGIGIKIAFGWLRGALKRVPWQIWVALAAIAIVWMGFRFIGNAIENARSQGKAAGVAEATINFQKAQAAADMFERKRIAKLATTQTSQSKGTDHALDQTDAAIDRRSATLRLRFDAARAGGSPRGGNLPGAAPFVAEARQEVCDGLPFDVALAALTEAQHQGAQLNALIDEYEAQRLLIEKFIADSAK